MPITIRDGGQPNTANQQKSVDVSDLGKSRTAYKDRAALPQSKQLKFLNVKENFTFPLPANVRLHGEIVVFNESANTQVAITVGNAAAGTQFSAGAPVATKTTAIQAVSAVAISRAASTVYVESAGWQAGVSLVFNVSEYPPVADTTALS